MGRVYKPTYCRPIPKGAEIVDRDGKRFARIRLGGPGTKPILAPLTRSGDRCIVPQSKYWAVYRDAEGKLARAPLRVADLTVARGMLAEIELREERIRGGRENRHDRHLSRPLSELIDEFRHSMEDRDRDGRYVDNAVSYIQKSVEACEFRTLNDVDAVPLENYLATRRADGLSHGGHNGYVRALKAFGSWLVKNRRCGANPFATLARLNAKVDRRLVRRALTPDELSRLLAAAAAGAPFRELCGPDRSMLYRTAAETGLRASELASLTVRSLDLAAELPTIAVRAAYSKHRDNDLQPIPRDLATRLRSWLDTRGESGPFLPFEELDELGDRRLWPGTWHTRAAEMLREDLQAARARWIKEGCDRKEKLERRNDRDFLQYVDSGGRTIDFHALRGTLSTNLAKAGVHPKVAQQLMRHSDINLTMTTYTNLRAVDVAAELSRLPAISELPVEALAATGTDAADAMRAPAKSSAETAAKQCEADATCNETCNSGRRAQEQDEHNARGKSGAGRTRTDNPQIMSLLL